MRAGPALPKVRLTMPDAFRAGVARLPAINFALISMLVLVILMAVAYVGRIR